MLRSQGMGQPQRKWLITGAAGLIGSHLVEELLRQGEGVRALDNFSTGSEDNLKEAIEAAGPGAHGRFELIRGDIRNLYDCERACQDVDYILHQAALGSITRSFEQPEAVHENNACGFLNLLRAAETT